jgi:hypothetical protein
VVDAVYDGSDGNVANGLRLYHQRMILPNHASFTLETFGLLDGSRAAPMLNSGPTRSRAAQADGTVVSGLKPAPCRPP